jgi:hypothetical protein
VGRGAWTITPSLLPPELATERGAVLNRALRGLPIPLLELLLRGLRRRANALTVGQLYSRDGSRGCAMGVLLDELAERTPRAKKVARRLRRRRRTARTIHDEWPEFALTYPRVAHIEFIYDNTCETLCGHDPELSEHEACRRVGIWMAAETQAEVNLRHLETADSQGPRLPVAPADSALFESTVARLTELRPWLSERQAARLVEAWTGTRRLDPDPVFVPREWIEELELQRRALEPVG